MSRPAAIPHPKAERPAKVVRLRPEETLDPILVDFIRALARDAVREEYRQITRDVRPPAKQPQ